LELNPPPQINEFNWIWQKWLFHLYEWVYRKVIRDFAAPSSITLNTGTSADALADLVSLSDGNEYHIDEVSGVPGYDLRINFTNIRNIKGFVLKARYKGNAPTHYGNVELYNYVSTAFEVFTTLPNTGNDYNYRTILIPNAGNYTDNSGNAVMRVYHPVSGTSSHDCYIEYVALLD